MQDAKRLIHCLPGCFVAVLAIGLFTGCHSASHSNPKATTVITLLPEVLMPKDTPAPSMSLPPPAVAPARRARAALRIIEHGNAVHPKPPRAPHLEGPVTGRRGRPWGGSTGVGRRTRWASWLAPREALTVAGQRRSRTGFPRPPLGGPHATSGSRVTLSPRRLAPRPRRTGPGVPRRRARDAEARWLPPACPTKPCPPKPCPPNPRRATP